MEASGSEVVREIEVDAGAEDVWAVVNDPDELAGWVGDEVRSARFDRPAPASPEVAGRRLTWTWAPDGRESDVELTVIPVGRRTRVRVVERATGGEARAALRWADGFLALELWALRSALAVRA